MITIARFKNSADAAFFQSVLQSEGIKSLNIDSGADLTLSGDIRIEVDEGDVARATELRAQYENESSERAQLVEATHPANGIPFYAIWFFSGIATFALWDGNALYALLTAEPSIDRLSLHDVGTLLMTFVCTPLWVSLAIAINIFVIWLVSRILKRRTRR